MSNFGSAIFNFALSLYVLDLTGSAAQFSMILGFSFLPMVVANLLGGVWVDKHNKKQIMVWSDLLSGLMVIIFMVGFHFYAKSMILLVCYTLILGTLQAFFTLSMNVSVPNLVSSEKVTQTNSMLQSISAICNIAGPVIGALTYKTFGMQMVFLLNGITLILAGIAEIFLHYQQTKFVEEESKSYMDNVKVTYDYLYEHKILGFLFIFAIVINFIFNALIFLVLPYINYHVIKVSGFQLSLIQAAGALGVILGAVFVSTRSDHTFLLKKFFSLFRWQAILIILWLFPLLPVFGGANKWPVTIGFCILLIAYGSLMTTQNVPMISYFQIRIPEEIRGRLFGVFWAALFLTTPLGLWLYGAILNKTPWFYVTIVSGVLMLIIGIIFAGHHCFKEFSAELGSAKALSGEDIVK